MKHLTTQTKNKLAIVRHALSTEIRFLDAYVNKDQDLQLRLLQLRDVYDEVDRIIERTNQPIL